MKTIVGNCRTARMQLAHFLRRKFTITDTESLQGLSVLSRQSSENNRRRKIPLPSVSITSNVKYTVIKTMELIYYGDNKTNVFLVIIQIRILQAKALSEIVFPRWSRGSTCLTIDLEVAGSIPGTSTILKVD